MNNYPDSRRFRQILFEHAEGLAEEMNLRLFLDRREGFCWEEDPESTLFVERISIMDIRYPEEAEPEIRDRMKGIRRIWSRLFDMLYRVFETGFRRKIYKDR